MFNGYKSQKKLFFFTKIIILLVLLYLIGAIFSLNSYIFVSPCILSFFNYDSLILYQKPKTNERNPYNELTKKTSQIGYKRI